MKNKDNLKKSLNYIKDTPKIKRLLKIAFRQKRKIKIKYYSLSSDEVKYRIVDIYQRYNDCIIVFCHLRSDERTFVIDRIIAAKLLDEKYEIPNGWEPESIILEKSNRYNELIMF